MNNVFQEYIYIPIYIYTYTYTHTLTHTQFKIADQIRASEAKKHGKRSTYSVQRQSWGHAR